MPSTCTCKADGRLGCLRHSGSEALSQLNRMPTNEKDWRPDPDGVAIFGRYPKGFVKHVLKNRILGYVAEDDILHVCSGTVRAKFSVDIRLEARPRVQADGCALPFRDESFQAIMLDPPYSDAYARNLYRTENPSPSWLLREASRVIRPGGRIGLLHVAVPFPPKNCFLVDVYGISTGTGYRIRAFTVFEKKRQQSLWHRRCEKHGDQWHEPPAWICPECAKDEKALPEA